ncbi:MAG: hypothetical protein KC917_06820 [Candidatus Omnitrophica bacterium]|nr:hypothetical protein [Candidatus Omnitrophota bacterium]MCA9428536.1 hypothetical protein [Candidatus Omnitrophota bacterium]MCA9438399.1 hypothetical protein [Candidatus Omnitrophota bacterium]MCA9442876.1 hypothetical protein [Candidatus Omnitrophota bacterium]MCB9767078.1 hypothetical protein [Candidatus Omnitrophota bacterium]
MSDIYYLYEPADIDTTQIEMLPDAPELFAFPVVLSGEPDPVWAKTFEQVWKECRYLNKLAATVRGDRIRFICSQKQGMEDYLYLIESRIAETNRRVEAYWKKQGARVERLKYEHYPSSFRPFAVV